MGWVTTTTHTMIESSSDDDSLKKKKMKKKKRLCRFGVGSSLRLVVVVVGVIGWVVEPWFLTFVL